MCVCVCVCVCVCDKRTLPYVLVSTRVYYELGRHQYSIIIIIGKVYGSAEEDWTMTDSKHRQSDIQTEGATDAEVAGPAVFV